jgi:hypothetical protein
MDRVFLSEYSGGRVKGVNGAVVVYIQPNGVQSGGTQYNGNVYFTLTGWAWMDGSTLYLQTLEYPNTYIRLTQDNTTWEYLGTTKTISVGQAQDVINGIIRNNQYILNNNLLCARFANKLTTAERQMLYNLQYRLEQRNEALQNDELLSAQSEGYPEGYSEFGSELESFMRNPGIGFTLSATAIICISAVVVGALSTAAYFAYKAYYDESAQDVKYSRQLTETLQAKLTEEEYQQLLQETAGLLTRQKITQQIASIGGNLKNLLLVGLGLLVALRAPQWIDAAQKAPVKTKKNNNGTRN